MTETTSTKADFTDGPLYKTLIQFFPLYVKEPFGPDPKLNVLRLQEATDKSHEAVYKWLRKSKLRPENVDLLVEIGNRPENLAVLQTFGRTPPTRETFLPFVFA